MPDVVTSDRPESESRRCSQCGQPLPIDLTALVCPSCELAGALEQDRDVTRVVSGPLGDGLGSGPGVTASQGSWAYRRFGDYELLEEIARGGMGIVYKARQVSLERMVAVKMILGGLATKEFVQRFRTEAATAASLHHPNIVGIHEVGVHEGEHFLAMDYVDGPNLARLIGQHPLPAPRAARYVKLIAEAVHFAHDRNILHRDLKPANVLIDSNDQPHISDFGLAKRLNAETDLTLTGQVLGSPNFMPPEQARGSRGKVGRHSDVYGLGGILYFALTARAPFQADSLEGVVHQVLGSEPVPPRLLNPGVPRDLETICLKALEKEPSRRYATALELAGELGRFLAGEPIQARPVTRGERVWRWCRRKPALAGSLGAALALLLVVVIGSPTAALRIERERRRAEQEANTARQSLYVADMNRVQQALRESNLGRARELLRRHQPQGRSEARDPSSRARDTSGLAPVHDPDSPDPRAWEWFHFDRLSQGDDLSIVGRHASEVSALAVSSDGAWIASASTDGMVKLWSVNPSKEIGALKTGGRVTALAFSPDSHTLVTLSHPLGCKLWDVRTQRESAHFHVRQDYFGGALAVSPRDGWIAISRADGAIELWDATRKSKQSELPGGYGQIFAMAFHPAEQVLIAASDHGTSRIWDVATGRETGRLTTAGGYGGALAVSPDGKSIAFGGYDGRVRVWDFARRELQATLTNHTAPVLAVAFSPAGDLLASGGADQSIRLWSPTNWQEAAVLRGHESAVRSLTFLHDGRTLASGSRDDTVRLWPVRKAEPPATRLVFPQGISVAGILAKQRCAVSLNYKGELQLWDLDSLHEAGTYQLSIDCSDLWGGAFYFFGTPFAVGNHEGRVAIWDWESRKEIAAFRAHQGRAQVVAVSADGRTLATIGGEGKVKLWSVQAQPELMFEIEEAAPFWMAFSPDGRWLATTHEDGTVALRDRAAPRKRMILGAHKATAVGTGFSPNGQWLATAAWDGTAKVWDLASRELVTTLTGQLLGINCLVFSPDNRRLAVGSQDGTIKLWDTTLWQETATFETHQGEIFDMAFLPQDGTFVSLTRQEVRVWPVSAGPFKPAQEKP